MAVKHGGVNSTGSQETPESLLSTANIDFVSVLVLWYTGVAPGSTYAWMLPHTLEKYLKAYLLKYNHVTNQELRKFGGTGHSLKKIWAKYKEVATSTTSKPKLNESFDQLVDDLDTISPNVRYTGYLDFSSCSLLYFYIVLCSLLRHLLIGKAAYRSSLYGLDGFVFLPMANMGDETAYAETIVSKVLHITLEHAGAFTNMGFVNQMDFSELSISNTAILQQDPNCPICKGIVTDQATMIKYYRNISG